MLEEAGDIIIPFRDRIVSETNFNGEIGQVIIGEIPGRQNDYDITLFKCVGMAALDLVTAHKIYKRAIEQGIGTQIKV